ncbi:MULTISPECIES: SusC/RagA family TonB-linked outer membrane protein [Flagellimonas]|uniref:TonB-dependent receptor n=1 Tax=Flagellimonas hadalis TaxID=2597517 RepID=A0A5N5IWD1_9FLAO|nr:TonB-dependent receptor [Allomuricauda hadalis]KAB5488237.1 TonB-dependent receptor [Allomuricauda hadalis]
MRTKTKVLLALLMAFVVHLSSAQEKAIRGTVTDENGSPLPGVNVVVRGTTSGTQTDFDGNYTLQAEVGQTLVFSYLGQKEVRITVGAQSTINVQMEEDAQALEEVVVVGYGVQKRKEITGAIASVSGGDIQGLVTPSFESQLAGRAAGVQITTNTGIIGEAPRIRIRGLGSIGSGTYPLVVVDGIPVITGDTGGYASTNALSSINPNDIESFEILKDGAATAIYGSRAANGVILITTKKGKKGTAQVSYNVVTGFASPIKTFDLLNTSQFLEIANEKRTNRGQAPWAIGSDYDTDWQKAVLRSSALQMDHNLSVNGGTDKTKYFLSLGFTDQDGVALPNNLKRHSIRTNLEHDVFNWLTVGGNVAVTRNEFNGLNTGGNSLSGNIFNATRQLPNIPIYDPNNPTGFNLSPDGSVVGQWDNTDPVGDNISNIGYVLANNKFQSKENNTLVSVFGDVKLLEGLTYRFQASANNTLTSGFLYYSPIHGDGRGSNGRLQNNNTDFLRWNTQNIINYNTSIADAHNIALTAVMEFQKDRVQSFFGTGTDLLDEFYNKNLVTGAYGTQTSGGSVTENGISSYVGRISYNFKERYFLQGSIRRDGISKLSKATRWNNFTGYSAGWNIANEEFFSGLNPTISLFKLRGSYSEVGNTDIGSYPYLGLTSASQYGTLNGIAFTQFGNDQLLWETSKKTDFGADLGFFNDKLTFSFDYYKNDIDGLILDVPVPHSLGVPDNRIKKNIGSMKNEGLEFSVNYTPFNTENFSWNVSANLTLDKNTVTSIPDGQDIIGGTSTNTNIAPNLIIREGESINSIYGHRYWGVNPANGNPVYYKADGSLVQGNIPTQTYFVFDPNNPEDLSEASSLSAADDKFILGTSLPTYYGSVINRFTYKGFDFSFMFRYSGGNHVFNATRRDLVTQNFNNNSTEILGRWQSPSEPGDGMTPMLYASSNTFTNLTGHATTRFLEKGDFISLDNITLGYKLPTNVTEKLKLNMVRFFIQGQNLLTITDYKGLNPEMESSGVDINGTPRSKVLSVGLNVNL